MGAIRRFVVIAAALMLTGLAPVTAPATTVPGACFTQRSPSAIEVSCPFTLQTRRLEAIGLMSLTTGPQAIVDIVLASDPTVRIAGCANNGVFVPPVPRGPVAACVALKGGITLARGTPLLCIGRGGGTGLIACASR